MVRGFQNLGNGGEDIEFPRKKRLRKKKKIIKKRKETQCIKIDKWKEIMLLQA